MREEKKISRCYENEDNQNRKIGKVKDEKSEMDYQSNKREQGMMEVDRERGGKNKLELDEYHQNEKFENKGVQLKDTETGIYPFEDGNRTVGDAEVSKHVTYNDKVEIIQEGNEKQAGVNEQVEDKLSTDDPTNCDPNFKRKVTFSNEIIVIAYNQDEKSTTDNDTKEKSFQERSKLKSGTRFGQTDSKVDEIRVNYANRVVSNRNIFKTVSFSNEVTVIHDGDLVFTSDKDEIKKPNSKSSPCRVDKLLNKLKKVVQKLEDKNQNGKCSETRDKKVLGDAEQYKTCNHHVQVLEVNQKQVAFSDHVESIENSRSNELREPNLRKVTFSKEIIVIAYPYKNEDEISFENEDSMNEGYKYNNMLGDRELQDQTRYEEIEESSVNYTEKSVSNGNIFKTVSFSNEVTMIHDGNLVFRSDSIESVKDNYDTSKEVEK